MNGNVDKVVSATGVGESPVEITLKKYYQDKDGTRYDKKPEDVEVESRAEVGLQLDFNPATWTDETRQAALEHSFTRKAQEHFQAVIRADGDLQVAVDGFPETYRKLMAGEREKKEGVKVDTREGMIRKVLAFVGRKKGLEAIAAQGLPNVPKTEKGVDNFAAWAKLVPADSDWYKKAAKQVDAADKF
jgi:hypothetical protein